MMRENKAKMATHTSTALTDSASVGLIKFIFGTHGKIASRLHDYDSWPNIDGHIEILDDDGQPIATIWAQVKKLPENHELKYPCPTGLFEFVTHNGPIFLFGADLQKEKIYWNYYDEDIVRKLPYVNQKTLTVEFDPDRSFTTQDTRYIEVWKRLVIERKARENPETQENSQPFSSSSFNERPVKDTYDAKLLADRDRSTKDFLDVVHVNYEFSEWKHAIAILNQDFAKEWQDIIDVLAHFRLTKSSLISGGYRSSVSVFFDKAFSDKGWKREHFHNKIQIDGQEVENPTHTVDCYKNRVAIEIEWNNKDAFFDRDLSNFHLLFEMQVISVGVIITRSDELQDIFEALGRGAVYGTSTTYMRRLLPKIRNNSGGGCPILAIGFKKNLYDEDE